MGRTEGSARTGRPLRRRKIIERPRLLEQLDESTARVRTLVAPAGYGKTTLAEQWVGKEGRRGVWYTARSASTDVAALALGVAKAATRGSARTFAQSRTQESTSRFSRRSSARSSRPGSRPTGS
jgi:ATP/maltotriose-dependent transcriptional regulator MalT